MPYQSAAGFQSTLSLRRATRRRSRIRAFRRFQSTLSLRRATGNLHNLCHEGLEFQSTLSLRRATGYIRTGSTDTIYFNPRSPCGERLVHFRQNIQRSKYFNPRSPCGERPQQGRVAASFHLFQSTLSLRRATASAFGGGVAPHISIHALLAESDHKTYVIWGSKTISIHALLAESDLQEQVKITNRSDFNPRSPCGERPVL